jgi:hypothetical protein
MKNPNRNWLVSELQRSSFKYRTSRMGRMTIVWCMETWPTLPQDVAVNHAWIEEIDFVYELSGGRKILFSKDDYYKNNKIINVRTYTAQEAITLIGVYGHWGPWN